MRSKRKRHRGSAFGVTLENPKRPPNRRDADGVSKAEQNLIVAELLGHAIETLQAGALKRRHESHAVFAVSSDEEHLFGASPFGCAKASGETIVAKLDDRLLGPVLADGADAPESWQRAHTGGIYH